MTTIEAVGDIAETIRVRTTKKPENGRDDEHQYTEASAKTGYVSGAQDEESLR